MRNNKRGMFFGLDASGLENKRDIITFLPTFICENTFLPPLPPARSYSRLFSLTSEEGSLCSSEASALSHSHFIVNNQEPAEANAAHIFAHNIKVFKTYFSTIEIADQNDQSHHFSV